MTVILEFQQQREQASPVRPHPHTARAPGPAEVIIFPGVRIERADGPDGSPDAVAARSGGAARAGASDSVDD